MGLRTLAWFVLTLPIFFCCSSIASLLYYNNILAQVFMGKSIQWMCKP